MKDPVAAAEALVKKGDALAAAWSESNAKLASMNSSDRQASAQMMVEMRKACPTGSLMPETIAEIRTLLEEAAKVDEPCKGECSKNEASVKMQQARKMVCQSALKVLEECPRR